MTETIADAIQPEELAHLHVHTEYSLLDGAIRIGALIKKAQALGHKAVAITDHGNLHGAIELYTKAKGAGIKAILGCEVFHSGGEATIAAAKTMGHTKPRAYAWHLVLLAKDNDGYKNLIKVVSSSYLTDAWQQGEEPVAVCPDHVLDDYSAGNIALSSCLRGEFGYLVTELRRLTGDAPLRFEPDQVAPAEGEELHAHLCRVALGEHVATMLKRFGEGNYYVELINNNLPEQKRALPDLVAAAQHYGLPLVATADAHYLNKEHAEGHTIFLGIKHGMKMSALRGKRKGTQFHVFDNDEMLAVYGAWPEALRNTGRIAAQCNVEFKFGKYYLPQMNYPGETPEDAMARIAQEMLEQRFETLSKVYGPSFDDKEKQRYRERLEYEIGVILKMGFASYFLIVQDFINWAKTNDIPVGPGRGSGAGSLVAYALRITDLDPLPYNLLFERFLNPERVSMPDFDVDFCQDRRGEVIKYVTDKYGAEQVAQITTFGKMKAKAVVRDVGRVMDLGYGRVDRFAKLIPDMPLDITLEDAIKAEPKILEEAARDDAIAELLRYARELEGLSRHTSVHAAGVVISDGAMTNYVPIYTVPGEPGLVTQFEMKMAEKVGLVKFDFLGLKTLTVIKKAVDYIRRKKNPKFDIDLIPLDDKRVYTYVSEGHTTALFQLESSGMRNLVMKLKPSCFEDIIALVALFRPGPLGSGMVDTFIECKHGRQEIVYILPQLEPILQETYGTILYQEQVMKIAGDLASYSLGEADLLRRAMGKKIKEEMEKQKERFASGAEQNGLDPDKAAQIFDLMAEFANYGFNKSHSAAYGLVSYQTAYLKVHFPEEFMAAIMTCDLDNTSKIVRYVEECKRMRIKVLPPCINRSMLEFNVPDNKIVDFGLQAIKGIGPQPLEMLVSERKERGPYKSLTDLARRVNLQKVGKKTLELLTQAGALDVFGISRPKLCELIGEIVRFSEQHHDAKTNGQRSLFDMMGGDDQQTNDATELKWDLTAAEAKPGAPDPEWLKKEKALLGVFITGHPLDFHKEDRRAFGRTTIGEMAKLVGKKGIPLVAVFSASNVRPSKKSGKLMASVRLEDPDGAIEAVMFEKEIPPEFPEAGTLVVATGDVDMGFDKVTLRYRLDKIEPLEDLRQENVRNVTVRIKPEGGKHAPLKYAKAAIGKLKQHFAEHAGDAPLKLVLDYGDTTLDVSLDKLGVNLTDGFLHGLGKLPFEKAAIRYELYKAAAANGNGNGHASGNGHGSDGIPLPDDMAGVIMPIMDVPEIGEVPVG